MSSPRTSMQKKRIPALDLLLFSPSRLAKDDGIAKANLNLENVVYNGGASQAIVELLANQNQFEFVFSVANDDVAQVLRQDMLDHFPGTAVEFASSHFEVTLHRLALFLYFLPTEVQKPQSLTEDYRSATTVPLVLKLLSSTSFDEYPGINKAVTYEEDSDTLMFGKKKQNQRQLKQLKKTKTGPNLDIRLIDALRNMGSPVPSTKQEADDLEQILLHQIKIIFCDFLDLLRSPSWARAIRNAYIPSIPLPQVIDPNNGGDTGANEDTQVTSDNLEVTSDNPRSAFPSVQPLKAALYFNNAKGFGNWRIFISSRAEKHLREHRKNMKTFKVIIKKITELSHGHFSNDNQKRLKGPDKGVPIFEAKMTGDLRLVYHVDCTSDYESEVEWQGLRIFGIFTHAQMDKRMWESLSAQLAKKGPEYRRRVILRSRPTITGDNVFEPLSWPDHSIREDGSRDDPALLSLIRRDDLPQIHQWIVLEKYTAFSQTLLNCIIADKAASAVFSVSPYERTIIEHTSSCFVLGRSGTGKTTTMLFKIFGIERAARMQPMSAQGKPRQLFVTQSRVLAGRVNEYYEKLSDFLNATAAKSLTELKELGQLYHGAQEDDGMDNPEDDEEWRVDIPKRFSELEDKHFPLFLTFDKLCRLLEADQGLSFGRQKYTREHRRAERRYLPKAPTMNDSTNVAEATNDLEEGSLFTDPPMSNEHLQSSLVSFESFCARYWPHFPQNLTKGLNTALVFNEFLGVIKGSEECLSCEKPYLPREMYLDLSERTQSTFASQRNRVYELFLSYLKLKQQYDDYDAADRSMSIISRIKDTIFKGVDYLYVDEAQDNLIIDALLLRSLCTNPDGLFWAGDTAQTIAVGSSFRFDDLKASLHRYEALNQGRMSQNHSTSPASFQLTTNYRSHGGIVNCAEMIIRLIKNFWPHSIDVLSQEKGLVDGEKPVIITGWDERNARYEQFLLGEDGSQIEFGAQQCILVRHDQARIDLRRQVGEIGVILTLYESKGLEFDDVLLFNFFEDSLCDASQWRVILNYGSSTDYGSTPPKFDEVRHAGICTELKFLYVAMTRARKNLWIIDRSEKVEPMKRLLSANGRVTVCTPETAPKLSVTSTTEEWAKTGKELFRHQRYSQAMHCFDRAGFPYEKSIAEAFYLRQQARIQSNGRRAAFSVAASAFSACGTNTPSKPKKKSYHHIAAECFREAEDSGSAAREFLHAEEYDLATLFFRKAGMFDDAISVIKANRENVDHSLAEEIVEVSKLHFLHEDRIDSALELFETEEDCLDFMEDFGFNIARSKILEALGRKYDAAELYFSEGKRKDAMRLLLSEHEDIRCVQRASHIILDQLWKKYAFSAAAPINSSQGEIDYEYLAESLDKSKMKDDDLKQLVIFSVLKKGESSELYLTQEKAYQNRDFLNATLVLNHYLRKRKRAEFGSAVDLVPVLKAYGRYAFLLCSLSDAPHTLPKVQKLLGFTSMPEIPEFTIGKHSMLYKYITEKEMQGRSGEDEFIVHEFDMPALIKTSITNYLLEIVRDQNQWITKTRARLFGTPCFAFTGRGRCYIADCQREHIDTKAVDVQWLNLRVRLHFLQILFIKAAEFALGERERRNFSAKWVAHLFELLHPSISGLGCKLNLSQSLIPEMHEATKVIAYWLDGLTYSLNPRDADPSSFTRNYHRFHTFLDEVIELSVFGFHFDATRFRDVVGRSRFFNQLSVPSVLLRQNAYIVHDLVYFIDAYGSHFLDHGVLFVQHVLDLGLQMEITHLCYLLERLCSYFVLILTYQISGLHNCTLPRSWIQSGLQELNLTHRAELQGCELAPIWQFLDILFRITQLLISESSMASNLLNSSDANFRNTSISRICRCIVLLGYNFRNYTFRKKIIGVFNDMHRNLTFPPWPLKQYIYCKSWTGFERIVHSLLPMTKLDSMIQLVHKGEKPKSSSSNSNVLRIEFKEWKNVLPTLEREFLTSISQLSASAASFVPKMTLAPRAMDSDEVLRTTADSMPPLHGAPGNNLVNNHDAISNQEEEEDEVDKDEDEDEDEEDGAHIEQKAVIIPEEVGTAPTGYSDGEKTSAVVIQRWFKTVLLRRASLPPKNHRQKKMQFNLAHVYKTCLKLSVEKAWAFRLQRIIFLGPLPHILVCLDKVDERLKSDKKRANDMINGITKESHMAYEEIMKRSRLASERRKQLETLKKLFSPTSNWHSEWDFEELQCKLREVEWLINELKLENDVEIFANLPLVKKAILEERKTIVSSKRKAKPELNTEDIYGFEDYLIDGTETYAYSSSVEGNVLSAERMYDVVTETNPASD